MRGGCKCTRSNGPPGPTAGDSRRGSTCVHQHVHRVRHLRYTGQIRQGVCDMGSARTRWDSDECPSRSFSATEIADGLDSKLGTASIYRHAEPVRSEDPQYLHGKFDAIEVFRVPGLEGPDLVDEEDVAALAHATAP